MTWLDDEVTILDAAQAPASHTLNLFSSGFGQHEHPPLSDLILHYWSLLASQNLGTLRLLNISMYCLGGWLLVLASRSSEANNAEICTAALFLLSPFGYHFGRMFGWYSFSFAAASALSYFLIRTIVHGANWYRVAGLIAASTALVYINYFGWAVVGLAACIYVLNSTPKRPAIGISAIWATITAFLYLPLWRVMLHQITQSVHPSGSMLLKVANCAYALHVFLVSEAIAPWAGPVGAISAALVMVVVVCAVLKNGRLGRCFFLGSLTLVLAMAFTGSLLAKRLIIIYPWFLLGLSWSTARIIRNRNIPLIATGVGLLSVAWFGILDQRYYSAFHSIEPWRKEAAVAADMRKNGSAIVTNSAVFLFYLTYELRNTLPSAASPFMGVAGADMAVPEITFVSKFTPWLASGRKVLFVEGTNKDFSAKSASTLLWLTDNCEALATERELPDEGFQLKKRLFPDAGQVPFRITRHTFDCTASRPTRARGQP